MSLISVGKKIGDLDLRIGIPPSAPHYDRQQAAAKAGYNNVSTNRNSILNRFRSSIQSAEGLARPTQFIVTIDGPNNMSEALRRRGYYTFQADDKEKRFENFRRLATGLRQSLQLRLDLFCSDVSIPGRTITDDVNEQYYGPSRSFGKNVSFDELTLSFYTGQDFDERIYFEAWQNMVIDPISYDAGYYDDYAAPCKITITPLKRSFLDTLLQYKPTSEMTLEELEKLRGLVGSNESAYQLQCYEVYPKSISAQQMSYSSSNAFVKVDVTFKYRYWASTTENVSAVNFNNTEGKDNVNQYRKNTTIEGGEGFLDNLPFGLGGIARSVGRQVYEKFRRDAPIGRITGGRVFPKGLPDPKIIRDILY